jgi:hypothetical protein
MTAEALLCEARRHGLLLDVTPQQPTPPPLPTAALAAAAKPAGKSNHSGKDAKPAAAAKGKGQSALTAARFAAADAARPPAATRPSRAARR